MATRPHTVAFDVVETLMSLEPLRTRFTDIGLEPGVLERWFDRLLRDGMALTLAGDYAPFPRVGAEALRAITQGKLDDDAVQHVMAGLTNLPAQPDAEPAMRTLTEAGVPVVCLTNGTAATTQNFLEHNGLDALVDQVISVVDVQSWKPPARVYHYAVDRISQPADRIALVAVHAWDCHGAHRAGLTTGWSSRLEGHFGDVFAPADVVGSDLVEVAQGLLALPADAQRE